jgi:hypothetical protein
MRSRLPNAAAQPRLKAGAQRTLEGVGCSRLFGAAVGTNSPVLDRSLAPLARITDLDEWLALLQAGSGFRKARA